MGHAQSRFARICLFQKAGIKARHQSKHTTRRHNTMSKVKKEVLEAAVLKLLAKITTTMPTPTYKFLLGSATALMTVNNRKKVDEMLCTVADADGYIDLDQVRAVIDGGFDASGGKISIDLFKKTSGLMSLLVSPLTLTISKQDIDELLAEVEQEAIPNVSISNV